MISPRFVPNCWRVFVFLLTASLFIANHSKIYRPILPTNRFAKYFPLWPAKTAVRMPFFCQFSVVVPIVSFIAFEMTLLLIFPSMDGIKYYLVNIIATSIYHEMNTYWCEQQRKKIFVQNIICGLFFMIPSDLWWCFFLESNFFTKLFK